MSYSLRFLLCLCILALVTVKLDMLSDCAWLRLERRQQQVEAEKQLEKKIYLCALVAHPIVTLLAAFVFLSLPKSHLPQPLSPPDRSFAYGLCSLPEENGETWGHAKVAAATPATFGPVGAAFRVACLVGC